MREHEPTSTTENFEIEFHGATHRGKRVILRISDDEIRQEVRYESLRQIDPDSYRPHEAPFMRAIAAEIMWRLVAQWKATHGPAKVEPRPQRRRRSEP